MVHGWGAVFMWRYSTTIFSLVLSLSFTFTQAGVFEEGTILGENFGCIVSARQWECLFEERCRESTNVPFRFHMTDHYSMEVGGAVRLKQKKKRGDRAHGDHLAMFATTIGRSDGFRINEKIDGDTFITNCKFVVW
jgi:hypothetical protein